MNARPRLQRAQKSGGVLRNSPSACQNTPKRYKKREREKGGGMAVWGDTQEISTEEATLKLRS